MDELKLTLLAHASAHRELLVNLHAHRFLEEPDPVGAAKIVREMFTRAPTTAPSKGSNLDPATSDLLAAMTDEAIEDIMDRVIERLETLLDVVPNRTPPEAAPKAPFAGRG
jgi:hypothetical protein